MTDDRPRLLAVMGSGETAPAMSRVHRDLLARLTADDSAVLLDTPFGFQENAAEICERTRTYFRRNLGADLDVASWRGPDEPQSAVAEALARIRTGHYVFAGPGSPTYALRVWRGSALRAVLLEKLARGGCVTFSSAAALTLGAFAVPVYEIYKCGAQPYWEPGLDLLGEFGLTVAVVPHFNNAEGRTHDTRFAYLGEQRLRTLEAQLPEGAFVLGVDEHTACVLDLAAGTAAVHGLGSVTVRRRGHSVGYPSGSMVALQTLSEVLAGSMARSSLGSGTVRFDAADRPISVRGEADRLEAVFAAAVARSDDERAAAAVLELAQVLLDWFADTEADDLTWAQLVLRRMVAELASGGAVRRRVVTPLVEVLLRERELARAAGHWERADDIRAALSAAGVELQDRPEGTNWLLTGH